MQDYPEHFQASILKFLVPCGGAVRFRRDVIKGRTTSVSNQDLNLKMNYLLGL